jgi:hypothetical protein
MDLESIAPWSVSGYSKEGRTVLGVKRAFLLSVLGLAAVAVGCGGGSGQSAGTPSSSKPDASQSQLAAAVSKHPAAGACAEVPRTQAAIRTVRLEPDVPDPRCSQVYPSQRLRIVNASNDYGQRGKTVAVQLADFRARLAPGKAKTFDASFGSYLAPGDHVVTVSFYSGSGPELFLKQRSR